MGLGGGEVREGHAWRSRSDAGMYAVGGIIAIEGGEGRMEWGRLVVRDDGKGG